MPNKDWDLIVSKLTDDSYTVHHLHTDDFATVVWMNDLATENGWELGVMQYSHQSEVIKTTDQKWEKS